MWNPSVLREGCCLLWEQMNEGVKQLMFLGAYPRDSVRRVFLMFVILDPASCQSGEQV